MQEPEHDRGRVQARYGIVEHDAGRARQAPVAPARGPGFDDIEEAKDEEEEPEKEQEEDNKDEMKENVENEEGDTLY